ncbi:MAG: hypothetical protein ABT20_00705 [Rubrivivax sp. SCN 70-15]|nr:MAG: hypothetical protein ABT20_00705 [Rubrivivax sp. SCN 70-15]
MKPRRSIAHAIAPMRRAPSESAAMPETSTSTGRPRRERRLECVDVGPAFEPGGDAGDQPAAADADQHALGQAGVGLDLGRQRAGAGHHLELVVGVHQQRAAVALARQAGGERVGVGRAADDDARTQRRQRGALGGTADLGHEDLARHRQRTGRGGHRDAGIAARRDHDAGRRQRLRAHAVEHAARLEAARDLQLLELEPDLGDIEAERAPGQPPQRRAAPASMRRRAPRMSSRFTGIARC